MAPLFPLCLSLLPLLSIISPIYAEPVHLPLLKRFKQNKSLSDILAAADRVRVRYGYAPLHSRATKRASFSNVQIIDQGQDSSYIASVEIGSPPQTLNVVLDTGSSDLWVADDHCSNCASSTPVFQSSRSNTVVFSSGQGSRVPLTYGSGQVSGIIAQDTVSMSSFTLQKQTFVAVDSISQDFLQGSVSGIIGLAFTALAQTGATPFWLSLMNNGLTTSPEMSFYLARLIDNPNAPAEAPGGTFTLGGTNSSLYTGNIEFTNIIGNPDAFWLLTISQITVQGKTIPISAGSSAVAAIDTGTTLIGGPTTAIQAIYNAIPNSKILLGSQGMYAFPCDTNVTVTMSFGGTAWSINPQDMVIYQVPQSNDCVGGFFDLSMGTSIPAGSDNPSWVVGDTFLKNVYSVFRANPPSVGFAQLSSQAGGSGASGEGSASPSSYTNGVTGTVPASSSTSTSSPLTNDSHPSIFGGKTKLVAILTSLVIAYSI